MPLRTQKLFSASTHLPHFSGRLIMSHNQRCRKTVNKLSPLREIKNFVEFVILPGAWDRLQNLTRSFDRRRGVSEESAFGNRQLKIRTFCFHASHAIHAGLTYAPEFMLNEDRSGPMDHLAGREWLLGLVPRPRVKPTSPERCSKTKTRPDSRPQNLPRAIQPSLSKPGYSGLIRALQSHQRLEAAFRIDLSSSPQLRRKSKPGTSRFCFNQIRKRMILALL